MNTAEPIAVWLSELVRIPSVSPAQAGDDASIAGEQRIARKLANDFERLGGEVYCDTVLEDRSNVYGIWRGRSSRWLGMDVHIDTVGVVGMTGDPFNGLIADGRVYGRGAVDTKATLATALHLLEQRLRKNETLMHNLIIAATVDEEVGASGAPAFAQWLRAQNIMVDELIVGEPTMCQPAYSHKGVTRMEFTIRGLAAHSAQPSLGKNAISDAARLITAFEEESQRLLGGSWPPQPGPPTLTVTLIEGGTGINVVPDCCRVSIDYRLAPGQKTQQVCEDLSTLAACTCSLPVTARTLLAVDAFYQPPEADLIQKFSRWTRQQPMTIDYGTNAWAYAGHSNVRECVVIGPGSIDQAHGKVEWVALDQLERYGRLIAQWWEADA